MLLDIVVEQVLATLALQLDIFLYRKQLFHD